MKQNSKVNPIFSKENQKKLHLQFIEGLKGVWGNDSKMVNYCDKEAVYLIPICGGKYLLHIAKESIKTDFWFGESDCGQGPSYEENQEIMDGVNKNLFDYFFNTNCSRINSIINTLKEIIKDSTSKKIYHFVNYYSSPDDSCVHGFEFVRYYDSPTDGAVEMEKDDVKLLLEAYELYKKDYIKRLEIYIKRYGTKHLHISSYWIDR